MLDVQPITAGPCGINKLYDYAALIMKLFTR